MNGTLSPPKSNCWIMKEEKRPPFLGYPFLLFHLGQLNRPCHHYASLKRPPLHPSTQDKDRKILEDRMGKASQMSWRLVVVVWMRSIVHTGSSKQLWLLQSSISLAPQLKSKFKPFKQISSLIIVRICREWLQNPTRVRFQGREEKSKQVSHNEKS